MLKRSKRTRSSAHGVRTLNLRALLGPIVALATLAACSSPAQRVDQEAVDLGLSRELRDGTEFSHVVYRNRPNSGGDTLHVYLEGDGIPWIGHRWVAADPTPHTPLMLRLMAHDRTPSVYLGRPCYFGLADTAPCVPTLWTTARYSERIVASMASVLRGIIEAEGAGALVLFGHSGGGTLAMLLAEKLPETRAVVTLAGNLDPDAWVELHGYTPLNGSLNPAQRPPLRADIRQLHLAGARDTNVPPLAIREAVTAQWDPEMVVLDGFDHTCCWNEIWSQVLDSVAVGRRFRPSPVP